MKLTVGRGRYSDGFALPTILLVATVMLIVLTASIAAAAASRVSLDSQYYNQLAQQAAQSGLNRANECLKSNGYAAQWATSVANRDLRPDSDCTGTTIGASYASAYVVGTGGSNPSNVRTKYSVEAPSGTTIGSILKITGTTELVRTSPPHSVWRSYEQSLYLRIEPPKLVTCPDGFIAVPGDARFSTNDFCVGKYEARNVGGKAASQSAGTPWTGISQGDAISAASDACSGCSLISEAQWLTIAHNAANVSGNWSGASAGSGYMFTGHNDNAPANSLSATTDDNNGYFGTGNSSGNQRRTLRLNNGEVIWDFSGNVFEWTSGRISGGKPGASGGAYRQWNAVTGTGNSISPDPFPAYATPQASSWTSANGIGMIWSNSDDTTLRAFRRGGSWSYGSYSGVFNLSLDAPPTYADARIGFRVALDPLATTTCPSGQVLVPGNSTFGTKNFCIGKYESKNVGGVATSQAAGASWVNITQENAKVAASNACGSCRLVSEGEWLTVAHNLVNVPSNWSGNAVGSGYIYRGHSDSSPASPLAASTNDGNGYTGTGNSSGNQRRTLKLNTGEIIWDIAGNVSEWSTGQSDGGQPGGSGCALREWNAIESTGTLTPSPIPQYGTPAASSWTTARGIGNVYSTTAGGLHGFRRGGGYGDGTSSGVFWYRSCIGTTTSGGGATGFRITSDPISTISCSSGMIPVPGDSRFGTTDFCVGKYEAKNVGGVARSEAAGVPWGNISQTNAVIAANAACAECRLIGESEWLTVAHNLVNVPSNWSGNAVGSGYVYRGHSDYSPAASLAASANDNDGFYGTGNASGNQRRTLSLSNGQTIWDFAGNIAEWTSGQTTTGQPGVSGFAWREWNAIAGSGNLVPNPFPVYGIPAASSWTSTHGIGRIHSDTSSTSLRGFIRSGNYGDHANAGIFNLGLDNYPSNERSYIGFRPVQYP